MSDTSPVPFHTAAAEAEDPAEADDPIVAYTDVLDAQRQLHGVAAVTPVMRSRTLDAAVAARGATDVQVFLKCENLQRIGAFKFRGAWNTLSRLSPAQQRAGVVTFSSGNHAQAVALAARLLGMNATIVMPNNAPATKKAATLGYGATVIEYAPAENDREQLARDLADEHGYTIVPPYDHHHVIAGAGTAALELIHETGALDALLVPCGGGGLLSGSAIGAHGSAPGCVVVGVEPEVANDAALSFRTGALHTIHNPPTIADGTRTPSLGRLTFPLVLRHVDAFAEVSEDAIMEAVRFAFYRLKLVVEPSGALGLAALLSGVWQPEPGSRIGVILSGGNVDARTMTQILAAG
jgi:threonine dehydratase